MSDIAKFSIGLIIIISGVLVIWIPLSRYIAKLLNATIQDAATISIVMLILNILALVIMVITIFANNKSSMDQIRAIKVSTMEQIGAIKTATQDHINKIEQFDKRSKGALLDALIVEYSDNLVNINDILKHEKEYCDETEKGRIAYNIFINEAFKANLINATIDNSELLHKIVRVYMILQFYQVRMESARTPNLNSNARVENFNIIIKSIKDNLERFKLLKEEIIQYKESHYN